MKTLLDLKKKAELKSGETQECNFIKSFIDVCISIHRNNKKN